MIVTNKEITNRLEQLNNILQNYGFSIKFNNGEFKTPLYIVDTISKVWHVLTFQDKLEISRNINIIN